MRTILAVVFACVSLVVAGQEEKDSVLSRCPVFITDTVSANNFFLELQPATVKVYRDHGKLRVQVQQRDQFFTVFFRDKKLKSTKYKITSDADNKDEVEAKYSFRSGGSASFVALSSGVVESVFDESKDLWKIKINGMLTNMVERGVTYYKVRAEFYIR